MSETQKTATFGGVALVLVVIALLGAPQRATPEDFLDRGEAIFPDFTDPNVATTLEVIDFDEATATARPFQVRFSNGRWTIPSHHDYPADGEDRLARTAAGVIDILKDDYRSDNVADHEALGVIGPLDDAATSLTGRGQRITLRGRRKQRPGGSDRGKTQWKGARIFDSCAYRIRSACTSRAWIWTSRHSSPTGSCRICWS